MAYDVPGFSAFFLNVIGGKSSSLASYNVNLRKADQACGGIDKFIADNGSDKLLEWYKENADQFGPYGSNVGSAIRSYLRYRLEGALGEGEAETEVESAADNAASVFRYEKELQQAVRQQLGSLENGMTEADEGYEAMFATGRSDILARDASNKPVVIELKAGVCAKGAIEQLLGYAQDWEESGAEGVRAILIAADFPPRLIAAAKRIPGLQLKKYSLAVQFADVS